MAIQHHCDRCGTIAAPSKFPTGSDVPLPDRWRRLQVARTDNGESDYADLCATCHGDLWDWFRRIGKHQVVRARTEVAS